MMEGERDTESETSEATSLLSSQEITSDGNPADLTRRENEKGLHARLLHCCERHRRRMRGVGSKGSILVLAWTFVVYGSSVSALEAFGRRIVASGNIDKVWAYLVPQLIIYSGWMLLYPLCGWLADVYFGRYRTLSVGLHVLWFGILLMCLGLVLESLYPKVEYYILMPAVVMVVVGRSAFLVNSVLFGSDQIVGISAEEISSYVIWYFFAWLSSRWVYNVVTDSILECFSVSDVNGLAVQTLFSVFLLSLVLCSNYFLRGWLLLSTDPPSENPWSLTWSVVKFAATHSRPPAHTTLTGHVKRIELGKTHYGGPFTVEQVNDVKTLLRVSLIIVGFCGLGMFIGGFSQVSEILFVDNLRPSLHDCLVLLRETYSYPFIVTFGVPLYELLVYPVIKPWLPSMLKRVGVAFALAILLNVSMLGVSVAGNEQSHLVCILQEANTTSFKDIHSLWVELPFNFLYAAILMVALTAGFEFIYAQTPYNMQGMAVGMLFGLTGVSAILGLTGIITWHSSWPRPSTGDVSCGVWFFLFTTVLGIIVLVLYCLLTHWYKRREREDYPVHPSTRGFNDDRNNVVDSSIL